MDAPIATPIDDTPFAVARKNWTMLADAALEMIELTQMPWLVCLEWCLQSSEARWRHLLPARHDDPAPEHHHELVVPDILEKDGGHALFV